MNAGLPLPRAAVRIWESVPAVSILWFRLSHVLNMQTNMPGMAVRGQETQKVAGDIRDNPTQEATRLSFSFTKAAIAVLSSLPWTQF